MTDNLANYDKVGMIPDDAVLWAENPFPSLSGDEVLLAIDDEGNVHKLGQSPNFYVVEQEDNDENS